MLCAPEFPCSMVGSSTAARVTQPSTEVDLRPARRRLAFVQTARHAFLDKGFAGTSMSSIAARVGGSKTTLWTYFPSKEALFAAVIDDIVEHFASALSIELPENEPVEIVLGKFGTALLNTVLSDPIMALHRLVLGEAFRFPQLAEMFHVRGAHRGQQRLAMYIEGAMQRGALGHDDPARAARQFAALCMSGSFQMALLGIQKRPEADVIAAEVRDAVIVVMKAWGTDTCLDD
jgi:TetR/AcrR family transcriptional regulator, mexJK operon transcriptional repressor